MSPDNKKIKLFNIWSFDNVEVPDFTLTDYINLKPVIMPMSCGRHTHKRFWKSDISIIERFINRLLAPGFLDSKIKGKKSSYGSGKKNQIIKAVKTAFTLIEQITDKNPIQVLVNAICYAAPREETTRIAMGGISYASAVDITPQRRVDLAIKYLTQAIAKKSHDSIKRFEEIIAMELIAAGRNSQNSSAVKKKDEVERIAISAR
ncbi:MAG: 30S ribosomal protein S7 [Promethearchaeia archaeon]